MADMVERYNIPEELFWLHGPRPDTPVKLETADQWTPPRTPTPVWGVHGYSEVRQALGDPETFSSNTTRLAQEAMPDGEVPAMEGFLPQIDPPEHGKLRKLANHAFTPKVVADLEPRIRDLTHELLDAARDRGRLELVADLAYPLPVIVIAELLGVPPGDRALFKEWADELFQQENPTPGSDDADVQASRAQKAMQAWADMSAYLADHAAQRRRQPRPDLLTKLVEAEVDGERLADGHVVNFATVLLLAGHITTTMLLGNTVLCLDASPEEREKVRADRTRVPAVIEESLRLFTPFAGLGRATTREVELGGTTIPANQMVMLWLGSANRDPHQFRDPEVFDPSRDPNPHLGFGRGIHFCLGAPLARLEGRIALDILLDRYSQLHTDPDDPVEFSPSPVMTGVNRLPLVG